MRSEDMEDGLMMSSSVATRRKPGEQLKEPILLKNPTYTLKRVGGPEDKEEKNMMKSIGKAIKKMFVNDGTDPRDYAVPVNSRDCIVDGRANETIKLSWLITNKTKHKWPKTGVFLMNVNQKEVIINNMYVKERMKPNQ
jgi:hypothetical protein